MEPFLLPNSYHWLGSELSRRVAIGEKVKALNMRPYLNLKPL